MTRKERVQRIRRALGRWYRAAARDLPWRKTRDPYAIWVSEIMLQQTRVTAVVPYYRRFVRRFPTVRALARARLDSVLKAWESMGYYARARNLHRAARAVVREHAGKLPTTAQALSRLPGIGRYTAAAVASIAFGRSVAVLDGNVTRVLCRLFCLAEDPRQSLARRKLWKLAEQLLPPRRPGAFNQAMMELGATICLPRRPRCDLCPLKNLCGARRRGRQEQIPLRRPRKPLPHVTVAVGAVWKNGCVLIDRRKPEGLLGGLWELPGGRRRGRESLQRTVAREIREELGVEVEVLRPLAKVRHAYTHFRITLHAFECRYRSGRPRAIGCDRWRWVRPKDLRRFAFPAANQKITKLLSGRRGPSQ